MNNYDGCLGGLQTKRERRHNTVRNASGERLFASRSACTYQKRICSKKSVYLGIFQDACKHHRMREMELQSCLNACELKICMGFHHFETAEEVQLASACSRYSESSSKMLKNHWQFTVNCMLARKKGV